MATITTPEEWWSNLSEKTQDRLAIDPGAPVPEDLRAEVMAASRGDHSYPPFQDFHDYGLRGWLVAYINSDNEVLLASIASYAGVPNSPMVEEWKMRARRRGLIR